MRRLHRFERIWLAAPIGAALVSGPIIRAQSTTATARPVSYVASIKPNAAADARTLSEFSPGGRFDATAITVRSLLRLAYRVQDYQLVGAPAWFSSQRFDIAAK